MLSAYATGVVQTWATIGGLVLVALLLPLVLVAVLGGKNRPAATQGTIVPGATSFEPGIVVLTLPPVEGCLLEIYDGRYRLWTAAHGLAFDAVPRYADGGPATAALDAWVVSTESLCRVTSSPSAVAADDRMHTLSAWRGDPFAPELHPLHGSKYPTSEDASRVAYEAGLIGFMVYQRDAATYHLPS